LLTEKLEKIGLSSSSLKGKVVIITGAGQGIGKELAIALSRLGASVVIAEIKDTGAQVESSINSEGGSALFVKTDVSDEGSVRELAEKSFEAFGKVDIVINNAIVTSFGSVLEQPLSAWDRVLAVNFKGALIMIKTFLPGMLERKDGAIANVLSNEGIPYLAPYSASKEALRSLTTSLVAELGEGTGVSVFNLAPGMVDTPFFDNPGEGRLAADDIARAVMYAVSQPAHVDVNEILIRPTSQSG
jgi:NAD(P)-dependent dehydrogenase (short-subunit alcohol dehydrogenase family)